MRWAWLWGAVATVGAMGGCGARTGLLVPLTDAAPDANLQVSGKVDLLFMIDNSGSMGDKQELLRQAIPDLLDRLIHPKCIDDNGNILADSQNGSCSVGHLEFKPVPDIHIAIVTSSMGGAGSDACSASVTNPVDPSLSAHNDDQGHLINRAGDQDSPINEANPSNFLAWFPNVEANKGNPKPPVTAIDDPAKLISLFQSLVAGAGQYGCGFESQLESWYHFLVQPDPYASLQVVNDQVQLVGVDTTILQQRHDFLRPDSLVGVVVVTDENDSNVDPLALGGEAWKYLNSSYPNSATGGPPLPTSACSTSPLSPDCKPCPPGSPDPACFPNGGFYVPADNPLNVRMFHMHQRFGVDPQYPIQRYVDALSSAMVPDRNGEHPNGSPVYIGKKDCVNPLFAQNLPVSDGAELCNMERGPRSPELVYFAVIGGVPHQLLQVDPKNPDSPQKNKLTETDWNTILGVDPLSYDFDGVDPHMIESLTPRAGLPGVDAPDDSDPMNGREWDTKGTFLEYACTFQLQTPRDCTDPKYANFCDCTNPDTGRPPICDANTPTLQIKAKAFPTIRELALARQLGTRATVSSLCPIHITESAPNDPLYGYRPAIAGLITAFRAGLVH